MTTVPPAGLVTAVDRHRVAVDVGVVGEHVDRPGRDGVSSITVAVSSTATGASLTQVTVDRAPWRCRRRLSGVGERVGRRARVVAVVGVRLVGQAGRRLRR